MVDQILALPEGSRVMLLAPVVDERKGEHIHILEELRSQGFIRARINGHIVELDSAPQLDPKRSHSIDVVVDRIKVRPDLQTRLADSIETALRLSNGLLKVCSMDAEQQPELVFSSRYACPGCGHSLCELEPQLFSLHNPTRACTSCDGLGMKQFVEPARVVAHPQLALAAGAIRGWDRRNQYYFQMITSLAKHYEFDIDSPFQDLPAEIQQIILHGSQGEPIQFSYIDSRGKTQQRTHPFEGILPNIERRYRDTDSNIIREELARYLSDQACPDCDGTRLNVMARHVFIADNSLPSISRLPIGQALQFFEQLRLPGNKGAIASSIVKEISARLGFLVNVGLDYLSLNRSAQTLSGGEAQRIRLASQIGAGLVGVMYVLDEPSIGLHQRDNERLLNTLMRLRDLGNTVIVVEHDEDAIRAADYILDMGPGAGVHGGRIIASGRLDDIVGNEKSITGQYLSGQRQIRVPEQRHAVDPDKMLRLFGASGNNLRDVDLELPIGLFTCITGVSGSGKSTLINETLYPLAATQLNKASTLKAAPHTRIEGLEHLDKCVDIDQSPIGRTPRSNPATYTGIFTPVREIFAGTQEARSRGYKPGRFSFNVKGGRCEACQGDGVTKRSEGR